MDAECWACGDPATTLITYRECPLRCETHKPGIGYPHCDLHTALIRKVDPYIARLEGILPVLTTEAARG